MYRTKQSRSKADIKELEKINPKSSNRLDIIDYLLLVDIIPNYILKLEYDKTDIEDETLDIWLMILEIDLTIWDNLYLQGGKSILRYVSGLIYRQIASKTSNVYRKYKRVKDREINISQESWNIYSNTNIMNKTKLTDDD